MLRKKDENGKENKSSAAGRSVFRMKAFCDMGCDCVTVSRKNVEEVLMDLRRSGVARTVVTAAPSRAIDGSWWEEGKASQKGDLHEWTWFDQVQMEHGESYHRAIRMQVELTPSGKFSTGILSVEDIERGYRARYLVVDDAVAYRIGNFLASARERADLKNEVRRLRGRLDKEAQQEERKEDARKIARKTA